MLGALPVKPDLILSGINRGANLGTDLIYSGTAAAARQGSLFSVPSIALSLVESPRWGEYYWDMAVSLVLKKLEEWASLWEPDTFLNINIPNSPEGPGGASLAFPCRRQYGDGLSILDAPDGNRYCFALIGKELCLPEPGSDRDTVSRNLVSLSPVLIHPVNRTVNRTTDRIADRTVKQAEPGGGGDL
jgi:5'-nucleotidase